LSQEALSGILPSLSNLGLPTNVTERLIQSLSSAEVLAQLTGSNTQGEPGVIQYTGVCANGGWPRQQDTIQFHWKDCKHLRNISVGTKVGKINIWFMIFDFLLCKLTNKIKFIGCVRYSSSSQKQRVGRRQH
jgi:hypothetical protein